MATNIVFKITGDAKGVTQELDSAGKAAGRANKEVTALQSSLNKIGGAVLAGFAIHKIIEFGKEIIKVNVEVQSLKNRFEGLVGSAAAGEKEFTRWQIISDKLGLKFTDLASSFIEFAQSAKQMGVPLSESRKMFEDLTVAIAGAHLTTQQQQSAMLAITQMMSKGKIQAQELTLQLGTALPGAIGIMAKSLNVSTAELNKLMEGGKLISSEVLPKFAAELRNTFGGQAELAAKSLQGTLNRLSNEWVKLMHTFGQTGIADFAVGALVKLIGSLNAAVSLLTGNWAKYQQQAIDEERFNKLTEHEKAIQKVIDNRVQTLTTAGLTEEEILEELRKSYDLYDSRVKDSEYIFEKAADKKSRQHYTVTQEMVTEYELNKASRDLTLQTINAIEKNISITGQKIELTDKEQAAYEKLRKEIEDLTYQVQLFNAGGMETAKGLDVYEEHALKLLRASKAFKASNDEIKQGAEQIIISDVAEKKLQLQIKANADLSESQRKLAEQNAKDSAEIDKFNDELIAKEDLKIQRKYDLLSATASSSMQQLQIERKRLDEELKLYEKNAEKKAEINQKIKLNEINQDNLAKAQKDQNKQAEIQMIAQAAIATTSLIGRGLDKQQADLEKQKQRGLISEREYENRVTQLNRKKFNADKAASIARIVINTAEAVVSNAKTPALIPFVVGLGAVELGIAASQRNPYFHGTKSLPGSDYSKDSIPILAAPGERIVPNYINRDKSYSGLMDLVQDRRISPDMAKHLTNIAITGYAPSISASPKFDYDQMGKSMAKYVPVSQFSIDREGVAMISVRQGNEKRRLKSRL